MPLAQAKMPCRVIFIMDKGEMYILCVV